MRAIATFSAPLRRRLSREHGSMLLELLMAMTFLAVGVGAIMALYSSTIFSMRHASMEGNALTLADKQIEVYKTLQYTSIQLASSTIPSGSDPYVTANSSDATIPASTGQVTTSSSPSCSAPTTAQPECAVQYWTGPDGLAYRVDTYIVAGAPAEGGRNVKQITVAVRRMQSGSASTKIWARATTTIDQSNPPQ